VNTRFRPLSNEQARTQKPVVSVDGVDSTLGFYNLWTIGKERNEVTLFRLGLLERMFRKPPIGDGQRSRHVVWFPR